MGVMVVVATSKQKEFQEHYWCLEKTDEALALWKKKQRTKDALAATEDNPVEPNKEYKTTEEDRRKLEVVAPDTAELLKQDTDFSLYRVIVLKQGLQWFKEICREFRYTVRDFVYKDIKEQKEESITQKKLEKDEEDKKKRLRLFCITSFPDSVRDWLHIKMIRVFIESVLRYGIPTNEQQHVTTILKIKGNLSGSVDKILRDLYKNLQASEMQGQNNEDNEQFAMMGLSELRPYVFIP